MKLILIALLFPLFAYADKPQPTPQSPDFFAGDSSSSSSSASSSTSTNGGNTTNIDQSDNSQAGVYLETLAAPTETVGNVTCGGVTYGIDTIKQEKGDTTGVFRVAYAPPTATCKKAASLQAENIRMQNLREVGQTILLCRQLRMAGASSDSDDQAIRDLMAFCQ